jgi:hypothetical protein
MGGLRAGQPRKCMTRDWYGPQDGIFLAGNERPPRPGGGRALRGPDDVAGAAIGRMRLREASTTGVSQNDLGRHGGSNFQAGTRMRASNGIRRAMRFKLGNIVP